MMCGKVEDVIQRVLKYLTADFPLISYYDGAYITINESVDLLLTDIHNLLR